MIISEITIKNFRSIKQATFKLNDLNMFVGLNDAGKSNVLKALNLFFNEQPDTKRRFDFQQDFSSYAQTQLKKAPEIEMLLKISLPGYTDPSIVWQKTWRDNDGNGKPYVDRILKSDWQPLSRRSHSETAARRLKYRYIPAVKSSQTFQDLLKELYLTMSESSAVSMKRASQDFSDTIVQYTKELSKNIHSRLNINSSINIPDDMSSIFSKFQFNTTNNKKGVPLDMRGDGIQARHIPPLLKFISEHDMHNNHRGKIPTLVIWGYEEPENGVEMLQCFNMAKELLEYSSDFQMLITTHSPGFYSIGSGNDTVSTFYTFKSDSGTTFTTNADLDKEMGFMQIVAPYIQEKSKEIDDLKTEISKYKTTIIFVEGKTDEQYLRETNKLFNIFARTEISIQTIGSVDCNGQSKNDGCDKLESAKKLLELKPDISIGRKIVFLFDCDTKKKTEHNGTIYTKCIAHNKQEETYTRGIENLLVLPASFEREKYYSNKKTGYYGESVQCFNKSQLCSDLIALPDREKRQIFANMKSLLEEIKSSLNS